MMSAEQRNRGGRRGIRWIFAMALVITVTGWAAILVATKPPASYRFITASHPIDVMNDGSGRWYYFMVDGSKGGVPAVAAEARKELLAQGFTEDTSNKPWNRFVK